MTDKTDRVDARFRARSEEIAWRDVEGDVIVLDLRTNSYLSINRTAAPLWARLATEATLDELATILVADHGLDDAQALHDANAFVESLRERDLLA